MGEGKKLFIVESPNKVKTLSKILGGGYVVKASVGHIRDLPERSTAVDVKNNFAPQYVISPDKKKVVEDLKKGAKNCSEICLATDPDREGEAISWHLREVLAPACKGKRFVRVRFNEVTPRGVQKALAEAGDIDMNLVDAQQARRVLDRLVGYKVSPLLWRKLRNRKLSAGRVQSVALRLVCDREAEIEAFQPVPYWVFGLKARKLVDPLTPFSMKLSKVNGAKAEINTAEAADRLREDLKGSSLAVSSVNERTVSTRPQAPFTTSTLQQSASNALGFSPTKTMKTAQSLYEGIDLGGGENVGLITYMRTDSVTVSADARDMARAFIIGSYGAEFYPAKPNVYRNKGNAQEAHEAIRPTDVNRTPESVAAQLKPDERKLYELIWKRFVASQMSEAKIFRRTVTVDATAANAGVCQFSATASDVSFLGFMKVSGKYLPKQKGEPNGDEDDGDSVETLPQLAQGEKLEAVEYSDERKETKPPPRYNEASLVKALEEKGIGRPSTYATIISNIEARKYVDHDRKALVPTELGKEITKELVNDLSELFDVGFTASMETELDDVEEGKQDWHEMLGSFYDKFVKWLDAVKPEPASGDDVRQAFDLLAQVREWEPPAKRGKREYSDAKFVDSLRTQHEKSGPDAKPITKPQLEALVRILSRYRKQVPGVDDYLRARGYEPLIREAMPPTAEEMKKLELLESLNLSNAFAVRFVKSVKKQADSGRKLSEKQLNVINKLIIEEKGKSPLVTDAVLEELGLTAVAPVVADKGKAADLVKAFEDVKEWRPVSTRGKRTYDDAAFIKSIAEQFSTRGTLTPAQLSAVEKMFYRYSSQMKDAQALAEKYGLKLKK